MCVCVHQYQPGDWVNGTDYGPMALHARTSLNVNSGQWLMLSLPSPFAHLIHISQVCSYVVHREQRVVGGRKKTTNVSCNRWHHHWCKKCLLQWLKEKRHWYKLQPVTITMCAREVLTLVHTTSTRCKGQGRCKSQDHHQHKSVRNAATTFNYSHCHHRPGTTQHDAAITATCVRVCVPLCKLQWICAWLASFFGTAPNVEGWKNNAQPVCVCVCVPMPEWTCGVLILYVWAYLVALLTSCLSWLD